MIALLELALVLLVAAWVGIALLWGIGLLLGGAAEIWRTHLPSGRAAAAKSHAHEEWCRTHPAEATELDLHMKWDDRAWRAEHDD